MTLSGILASLSTKADRPDVLSLVLMGSHARGEAGAYSDVDLVRFVRTSTATESETLLLDGTLVVISTATAQSIDGWFSEPTQAVDTISGLRTARALIDRGRFFAAIQARAQAFVWDDHLQHKADVWASQELVGLIEEVHKGLNGLVSGDRGRLLNARFGLSWLLSGVIKVQRGVLLHGDNGIYSELAAVMGADSRWTHLRHAAWGIEDNDGRVPALREQVIAGLQLYIETVHLVKSALQPQDAPKIRATVALIRRVLAEIEAQAAS